MKKLIGAIVLVAGTCIGSGMIALPMLLSKLGIIPSLILMLVTWFIAYFTSLVNLELNLQAGKGLSLGGLGKKYSGKIAEIIGTTSFKALCYALLAVYLSGGASILQKMLEAGSGKIYDLNTITILYSIVSFILIILPINLLVYVNKVLFIGLFITIGTIVASILPSVNLQDLPLVASNYNDIGIWVAVAPVVFTAFGFQIIFHTLTDYCNNDKLMLKRVFFWGSLIPAVVYIIWTICILTVIYQNDQSFYQQMIGGKIAVGDLIRKLSEISQWPVIQGIIWCLSSLAIITSVVGVGLGLRDSLMLILPKNLNRGRKFITTIITIIPAYLTAVLIPNAFIAVLGFAGMILVIIAILLPIYLLYKIKTKNFYYSELSAKWVVLLVGVAGVMIIMSEVYNIYSR